MDNESDSIARKLFITEHASTSGRKQLKRRPIREVDEDLPSVVGVFCGIMVVMVALVSLPLMMVDCEGIPHFFNSSMTPYLTSKFNYFQDTYILGWFGALPLSIILGMLFGFITYIGMFYDSKKPGTYPPSPITPRKIQLVDSRVSLGYRMVFINFVTFSFIFLLLLRFYFHIPFN